MQARSLLTILATAVTVSAAPVMAADMPVKAPPPVVAAAFSWTGCYVGVHGGYGWGKKKWSDVGGEFTEHDVDGWLVGGQVGCNIWQRDRWVFGIEGQASWADIDGSSTNGQPTAINYYSKTDIVGTVALRLGYAVDRSLFFVKGGLAFAHDKHWQEIVAPGGIVLSHTDSEKYMRWGWMAGGGYEYAFNSNWSTKIEYNYMHLGREDVSFCPAAGPCFDYSIKQHIHVVKAGINYRFGGPVVARY